MKLSGFSISFSLWNWVKSTVETDFMLKVSVVRLWSVWASGLAGSLQHVNIGQERKTTVLHSCSSASLFILDVLNHWLGYYLFLLSTDGSDGKMGCMLREDKLFSDDPEKLRFQKLVCRDSLPGHVTVRSFAQTVPLSETIHSTLSSLCVVWIRASFVDLDCSVFYILFADTLGHQSFCSNRDTKALGLSNWKPKFTLKCKILIFKLYQCLFLLCIKLIKLMQII